jgi:hypothetical protein
MQNGGDRTHPIRGGNERSLRCAVHQMALVAQHGVHDHRRKKAKGGKADGSEVRERSFDPALLELVRRQSTEIPGEPEHGCEQEKRVKTEAPPRSPSRTHDHREEHRVEHDARTQPDQVQQLADVQCGRHRMPVLDNE